MLVLFVSSRYPADPVARGLDIQLGHPHLAAALMPTWPLLLVTLIQSTAQMAVFTYLEGLIAHYDRLSPVGMGGVYFCFGVSGILGNALLPRLVERIGPMPAAITLLSAMALAFAGWRVASPHHWSLLIPIMIWGLIGAAIGVWEPSRLLADAPSAARILSASHSSSIYLGQALGAALGGWVMLQKWFRKFGHWDKR